MDFSGPQISGDAATFFGYACKLSGAYTVDWLEKNYKKLLEGEQTTELIEKAAATLRVIKSLREREVWKYGFWMPAHPDWPKLCYAFKAVTAVVRSVRRPRAPA